MATETQFLGTGWAFPPSFDWRTKEAVLVSQVEDIEQSLHILLSTTPGDQAVWARCWMIDAGVTTSV